MSIRSIANSLDPPTNDREEIDPSTLDWSYPQIQRDRSSPKVVVDPIWSLWEDDGITCFPQRYPGTRLALMAGSFVPRLNDWLTDAAPRVNYPNCGGYSVPFGYVIGALYISRVLRFGIIRNDCAYNISWSSAKCAYPLIFRAPKLQSMPNPSLLPENCIDSSNLFELANAKRPPEPQGKRVRSLQMRFVKIIDENVLSG